LCMVIIGLCIKTRETVTGQKVFINLCTSIDVPEPDEYYTDEQMSQALHEGTDEEVEAVRMPMSIGEKHIEKDKRKRERER
jgi:hypothetical protein